MLSKVAHGACYAMEKRIKPFSIVMQQLVFSNSIYYLENSSSDVKDSDFRCER